MLPTLVTVIGVDFDPEDVDHARQILASVSSQISDVETGVCDGLAVSQFTSDAPLAAARAALRQLTLRLRGSAPSPSSVDVLVSPNSLRRDSGPRLVITDVDSTLIRDEVVELLAGHAGSEQLVTEMTDRAMRGEVDFATSLHERVATLRGLPQSVFADVLAQVRLSPGTERFCAELHAAGDLVGVVSGGFAEIVDPLAANLGIKLALANQLEVVDGHLTGRVRGAVVDRQTKAATLRNWAANNQIDMSRTVAIGDGANDLDMLGAAAVGIAFNAKPIVADQAAAAIYCGRLDAALPLLGLGVSPAG